MYIICKIQNENKSSQIISTIHLRMQFSLSSSLRIYTLHSLAPPPRPLEPFQLTPPSSEQYSLIPIFFSSDPIPDIRWVLSRDFKKVAGVQKGSRAKTDVPPASRYCMLIAPTLTTLLTPIYASEFLFRNELKRWEIKLHFAFKFLFLHRFFFCCRRLRFCLTKSQILKFSLKS